MKSAVTRGTMTGCSMNNPTMVAYAVSSTRQVSVGPPARCRHALALGLIGLPGTVVAFFAFTIAISISNPFAFVAGGDSPEAQMLLPDDGLDPAWSRRVVKMQVVFALAAVTAGMWAALARVGAR